MRRRKRRPGVGAGDGTGDWAASRTAAVKTKASASIPVGASPRRGATAGRLAAGSPTNVGDFLSQEGIPSATQSVRERGRPEPGQATAPGNGARRREGPPEGIPCEDTVSGPEGARGVTEGVPCEDTVSGPRIEPTRSVTSAIASDTGEGRRSWSDRAPNVKKNRDGA